MVNLDLVCILPDSTIRHAMEQIDRNNKGIVLVCDDRRRLVGTVTDGDIRRALLCGQNLDDPASVLLEHKEQTVYPRPVSAAAGSSVGEILKIMRERVVRQLPLLDEEGRVADLVALEDLVPEHVLPLQALIMTGGYGTRLLPLTQEIPKPMLPVGDRPLVEIIVEQLQKAGIRRVNLATHYKSEVIEQHFGDGGSFGVEIRYVREDRPLGTAGALSMLETCGDPLLVINGDIVTRVDFRAMLDFHREQRAAMTLAVREHELQVAYGVVETSGVSVTRIVEKPVQRYLINAGIYILNPEVCRFVPRNRACDMPELIARLVAENERVVSFLIREYWRDIGQIEDYRKALAEAPEKLA